MALKKTSALMNLGAFLDLVDGAGFTQTEIDLNMDALSREVFVITDYQLDYGTSMPVSYTHLTLPPIYSV